MSLPLVFTVVDISYFDNEKGIKATAKVDINGMAHVNVSIHLTPLGYKISVPISFIHFDTYHKLSKQVIDQYLADRKNGKIQ